MPKISSSPCVNSRQLRSLEDRSSAYLEKWVINILKSGRPFVLFRPPGASHVSCLTDSAEAGSPGGKTEFLFAPFNPDQAPLVLQDCFGFQVDCATLPQPKSFKPVDIEKSTEGKARYVKQFGEAQTAIHSGQLKKVVLSRVLTVPVRRDPWSVFLHLHHQYGTACCYWWYHPDSGHWMGATPELLLLSQEEEVEIMSLAGTIPADSNSLVEWSEKELEEQRVVTQYIEDILKQAGGRITKDGPNTVRAGNLYHLRTILKARIKEDLNSLIRRLHPTPAVCGYPAGSAYRLITDLEVHDREYYTGYFGVRSIDPSIPTQLYVNLRCLKWTDASISVFVGGGITSGSDADSEWQETITKSRTMLDALDITLV